ncbi:Sac2 family-domain-containing protein [Talaromyces proteolyticus]|uniref:Sac2 family-domain-containing protein n=1 Tax=Talaromyces proteolyticus TaxID=1131652 RepID=A0AAD4KVU2_9EURO|nr:Sac2 family-domain-containing protein [Talaromyces proteolyticus]KAH8700458.1 Sac2 family-domain-containing protein [Talaromyces proteolyticus]
MWLDRLSAHSTPSGTPPPINRHASPSQRSPRPRAAQAFRPGLHPRSSSTSLLLTPNDSTTSLPNTSKNPPNVPARSLLSRTPPAETASPVDVLNGIIGKKASDRQGDILEKPPQLVEAIDFGNLSLEEFVNRGKASGGILSSEAGVATIQQFEGDRDKFQELHNAIVDCDDVLKSVESYLSDFQTELGAVSAEIETLQTRSIQLNAKLENRRNVERLLGPAVEEISISPKTVRLIAEGPIDDNWVKALNEVESRSASIEKSASSSVKAVEDVKPLLVDLKNKATVRIRDYLVAQIKAIRSPNMNAQVIQQQHLIKYKDLYTFLSRTHPTLSEEIAQAYVNTMKWYYLSNFTRYNQALEKLKIQTSDQNNVLGGDPAAQRASGTNANGRAVAHDPFSLGRRADALRTTSHMAISSYVAEEDKATHGFEVVFRNFNLALVDNVSAEYSFLTEMFAVKSFHHISRKALEIFEPLFTLGQTLTKQLIDNTTDCLGVLLCVRLNQQSAFELQRRKVPVAESYINGINMQLWPRFQKIMDLHCESLKRLSSGAVRSSVSLSLTMDDANKSSAPHFLAQRFGQLIHGIVSLSNEAGDDEPVSNSLSRLTAEFDTLLAKLGRGSGDAKRRERFLYNNYSLILTIISDTDGKLASEQKEPVMASLLPRSSTLLQRRRFSTSRASNADFTHAVIGAGVVGLAIARQLAARDGTSTIVLERHGAVGTETSSRNSEVIHAGIYYPPTSLKTRLCIRGKNLLYSLCASKQIPHLRTRKWIVAQDEVEWRVCLALREHAQNIGVPTRLVGAEEARRTEPDIQARAGIVESPTTGIVDAHALMSVLQGEYEERGGDIAFHTAVRRIEAVDHGKGGYRIFTSSAGDDGSSEESSITAETLINSAGLGACEINNMILPPNRHRRAYYAKGTYFSYSASRPKPSTLIYPAPVPGHGGLGTHLTRDMGGRVRFGPDVEWVESASDYTPSPARLQQALPEIKRYLPGIDTDSVVLDYCGIRPKLARGGGNVAGKGFQDFVIREEDGFKGFVNLLGIESPGLTSSLAIGEVVEELLYR